MAFSDVPIERVQRWWDARPCNVRHSSHPVGSLAFSQEVTYRRLLAEPHEIDLLRPCEWLDKLVFEAGCGIGTSSLMLARCGARVIGGDLSSASLRIARLRRAAEGIDSEQLRFYRVDLGGMFMPLIPETPDLIYSYGMIHHSPCPDDVLINLRKMAGPNTQLRIMVYHRWSLKGIKLGLTDRMIARHSEAEAYSPVTYAYSRRSIRKLLDITDWHVDDLWVDHIFKYRWQDWSQGQAVVALPWRILPDLVRRALASVVGWHIMIIAHPKDDG